MARLPRRHILHLFGASAVAAALALPMAAAASTPPPPSPGLSTPPSPGASTQGTSPGESSPSSPVPDSSATDTSGTSSRTGTTGTTNPTDTSSSGGTSDESTSPTGGDTSASQAPKQQKKALEEATTGLDQAKNEAPKELAPSVAQLTDTLHAVDDPGTSPQDRDAAIGTAHAVSSALKVIGDPGTPPAVRAQLTGLVRQVASALDAARSPGLTPEERRLTFDVGAKSATALAVISDPGTPPEERDDTAGAGDHVAQAASQSAQAASSSRQNSSAPASSPPHEETMQRLRFLAMVVAALSDRNTHGGGRRSLARAANEASSSLDGSTDSRASDEEREKAHRKLQEQLAQVEKELTEYLSAQPLPTEPLGKAAEICTNSVFERSVSKETLAGDLESVLPGPWNKEGVKEFWKSEEAGNETLKIFAELRNKRIIDAPLAVRLLVPKLADSIPAKELFTALGSPALHCLGAARQLDQDGVESGTWVKMAEEHR
ncbi:hypothetical protein [Streptomyces sp. IBSBF 3136]|uniref:hypothetical protein n=1 Tax=Streptomyces sp. IBSBF 3136 TaxID=2903524 RepID=UPI002FDC5A06